MTHSTDELRRMYRDELSRLNHERPDPPVIPFPACMFWSVPDEQVLSIPESEPRWFARRLSAWSADHGCALCGVRTSRYVLDHCHISGKPRGYICRGCNSSEGAGNDAPYMVRWRAGWNPGALLGIEDDYRDIYGRIVLDEQGWRLRMDPAERGAYDGARKSGNWNLASDVMDLVQWRTHEGLTLDEAIERVEAES